MKALYEKVQTANPRATIPDARTIDHTPSQILFSELIFLVVLTYPAYQQAKP
jgi:hypothetical protein